MFLLTLSMGKITRKFKQLFKLKNKCHRNKVILSQTNLIYIVENINREILPVHAYISGCYRSTHHSHELLKFAYMNCDSV